MSSYHESTKIIKCNKYRLGISSHKVMTEKDILNESFKFLSMSDFHTIRNLSKSKLLAIKGFLEEEKGKLEFITVPGDIISSKELLQDTNMIKKTFNEFSHIAGNIPVFIIPGNHEFGVIKDRKTNYIIELFKSLKTNNVIPLINEVFNYNQAIKLYGIVYGKEGYSIKNIIDANTKYLVNHLKSHFSNLNQSEFNIAIAHDCFSAYYSKFMDSDQINLKDFDIVISGHGHAGCNLYRNLCDTTRYYKGPTDYLVDRSLNTSPLPSYGLYHLDDNSTLIVTEGVTRFNGWLPQFFSTIPFVSVVDVEKVKKK